MDNIIEAYKKLDTEDKSDKAKYIRQAFYKHCKQTFYIASIKFPYLFAYPRD